MNSQYKLTKSDINNASWVYAFFHHSAQNYERMMGLAFCHVMSKPLSKLYPDKEEYRDALKRHMQFYNTEPTLGALIPGIVLALEEDKANGGDSTEELIVGVKNSLMGPFAGLGDSLLGATYMTIVSSIAIGLSANGSVLGSFFLLVFGGIALTSLKVGLFRYGYKAGLNAVKMIKPEVTEALTVVLSIVGLIVVGGITANMVNLPIKYVFMSGDLTLSIQDMLDKIMPGILPLILTIGIWLLYRKGWTSVKAILVLLASIFIFVLLGIM